MSNAFGQELRRLRQLSGLTIGELANHANFSEQYISQIEIGSNMPPPPDRVTLLAHLIGCDQRQLGSLQILAARQRGQVTVKTDKLSDRVLTWLFRQT